MTTSFSSFSGTDHEFGLFGDEELVEPFFIQFCEVQGLVFIKFSILLDTFSVGAGELKVKNLLEEVSDGGCGIETGLVFDEGVNNFGDMEALGLTEMVVEVGEAPD